MLVCDDLPASDNQPDSGDLNVHNRISTCRPFFRIPGYLFAGQPQARRGWHMSVRQFTSAKHR